MILDVILQNWLSLLAPFIVCAAICTVFELLFNLDRSLFSRVRGAFFWSICLFGIALGVVVTQQVFRAIGIPPLISVDLSQGGHGLNWVAQSLLLVPLILLPALVSDFAFYWCHRLQHAVPFLWRLHAVHHAIEELNGTNCYHHWSEGFVRSVFILLPLALLVEWKPPEIMGISILVSTFWGHLDHLNANIGFGPLDRLFVSPAFHRVHHSRDVLHFEKNFAGMFSILDLVFGTAHFPSKNENIATGLNDKHEAATLGEYLIALRDRR